MGLCCCKASPRVIICQPPPGIKYNDESNNIVDTSPDEQKKTDRRLM